MPHREIINKLSNLDLSTYPVDEVHGSLKKLGSFGVILFILKPGKRILRGRINTLSGEFDNISKVSYKPMEYNKTFMRASTPHRTMFYGSIVPELCVNNEPQTARITIINEISEFARDIKSVGEESITFSVWEVQKEIRLISLFHNEGFERPTELSKKIQSEFEIIMQSYPDKLESTLEIAKFLGEQFAKIVPKNEDFRYLISACYSEIVTELGFDGVLYPSVKLAGEGINVAIKPESVSKLKLLHVGECTLYKNKKKLFIGNNTFANINSSGALQYQKLTTDDFVSKNFGRRQVGLRLTVNEEYIDSDCTSFEMAPLNYLYGKEMFFSAGFKHKGTIYQLVGNLGAYSNDGDLHNLINVFVISDSLLIQLERGIKNQMIKLLEQKLNSTGQPFKDLIIISESALIKFVKKRTDFNNDICTQNLLRDLDT